MIWRFYSSEISALNFVLTATRVLNVCMNVYFRAGKIGFKIPETNRNTPLIKEPPARSITETETSVFTQICTGDSVLVQIITITLQSARRGCVWCGFLAACNFATSCSCFPVWCFGWTDGTGMQSAVQNADRRTSKFV